MTEGETTAAGAKSNDSMPVGFWVAIAAVPVGVIFLCCPYRISVLAPILVSLGLAALAYVAIAGVAADESTGRPHPLARLFAGVAALGVLVVVLALGGLLVRLFDGSNYRMFYGDKVTATIANSDDCEFSKGRRGRGGSNATCDNATWTLRGEQHTGQISVEGKDFVGAGGAVTLEAYAIGDKASSVTRTDPEYDAARIAGVPLWAGLAGIVLIVAGIAGQNLVPRRDQPPAATR